MAIMMMIIFTMMMMVMTIIIATIVKARRRRCVPLSARKRGSGNAFGATSEPIVAFFGGAGCM